MDIEKSDTMFDLVFGRGMHDVARVHYTPIEIVKFASEFLADEPGKKVLDVGSGAGKFCMVGSVHTKDVGAFRLEASRRADPERAQPHRDA